MEGRRVSHSWRMCAVSHGSAVLEVMVGKHAGQSQRVGRMLGDARALPECEVNTLITPDRTTIQESSSGFGRAGIDRSSWKGLNTGCHEKAPVHCPSSQMAAIHGAPWMRLVRLAMEVEEWA